jgi:hypothetical protein
VSSSENCRKPDKPWKKLEKNNRKSTTRCKSGLAKQEVEVADNSGGFAWF